MISKPVSELHWWTSLVPAPAVIPAPIAYINAVAVKKLVVGCRAQVVLRPISSGFSVLLMNVLFGSNQTHQDLCSRNGLMVPCD